MADATPPPRPGRTTRHRYPTRVMRGDYLLAATAAALCAAPLLIAEPPPRLALILGVLALLGLGYGMFVWLRHHSEIRLTPRGIGWRAPLARPRLIPWERLGAVRLAYYARRRALAGEGWMVLSLEPRGRGRGIQCDSRISDFETIVRAVAAAMDEQRHPLDAVSRANFLALGIDVTTTPPEPEWREEAGGLTASGRSAPDEGE